MGRKISNDSLKFLSMLRGEKTFSRGAVSPCPPHGYATDMMLSSQQLKNLSLKLTKNSFEFITLFNIFENYSFEEKMLL